MLGIIIAMQDECCNLMKDCFFDVYVQTIHNQKFYIVKTKNQQSAIIAFSGIGKANAAMTSSLMINNFNIKHLVNIGSCGILQGLNIKQWLIIDKLMYSDVDVTGFGYEWNQVPKMPTHYETDNKFNQWLKKWLKLDDLSKENGLCLTSDSFINSENFKHFYIKNTNLITVLDMEACAIAQVCYCMKVAFSSIKIGIDKLFEPIKNQEQFKENLTTIAKKIDILVLDLIDAYGYNFIKPN